MRIRIYVCVGIWKEYKCIMFQMQGTNIIRYINKYQQRMYLLSLDESAYDKEIANIADIEYMCQISDKDERRKYINEIIQHPLIYTDEYTYLDKQYCFKYWIQLLMENKKEIHERRY